MKLRLMHLDFDDGAAVATASVAVSGDGIGRLTALIAALSKGSVHRLLVHIDAPPDEGLRTIVDDASAEHEVDVTLTRDRYDADGGRRNAMWANQRAGESDVALTTPPVYAIRISTLETAVERLATCLRVIGACDNLNHRRLSQLRLACHELVTNSVEHAEFDREPELRVGLRFSRETTELSYRENGHEFHTDESPVVDVGEKISRGDRRGLGLHMLSQIADHMSYERRNGWNVTSLAIPATTRTTHGKGSQNMSGIEIMITPCKAEGTAVIRPVGTIDSGAAVVIESQISELCRQNKSRIVVDMADVDFISSSGIGVFLGSVSDLRSSGGDLLFMNVPQHVEDVFDIVNLKAYFRVISGLEELEPAR